MEREQRNHRWLTAITLTVTLLLGLIIVQAAFAQATADATAADPNFPSETFDLEATDATALNCRYGAAGADKRFYEQALMLPKLGAGWFVTFWGYWPYPEIPGSPEFGHIMYLKQEKSSTGEYLPAYRSLVPLDESLANYLRENPGELWMVGNEVERGPQPGETEGGQGDMMPDMYAQAYHEIYHFIKDHDPTARVAISGLVQVTPGRLQYLDLVWDAYLRKYGTEMPVDVWNMHAYVLPESQPDGVSPNGHASIALGTDPALSKRGSGGDPTACDDPQVYCFAEHDDIDIFMEQVVSMRRWMKDHGQQNKPLILSEYGTLYQYITFDDGRCKYMHDEFGRCFTPQRVSTYMTRTFDYLKDAKDPNLGYPLDDNRLIQQSLWFALYNERWNGFSANLLQHNLTSFTLMGETFSSYVRAEPTYVNLIVDRVTRPNILAAPDGATATIGVTLRNNGNTAITKPFRVTFYADEELTQTIDSVIVDPLVRGCATDPYTVKVDWADLDPGTHRYWVKLDSGGVIAEQPADDGDNIGVGEVTVRETYTLDVRIVSEGNGVGGTVVVKPEQDFYVEGERVRLEAIANPGWTFAGWDGALSGERAIEFLEMSRDRKVWARFTQNAYKLNVTVRGEGSVAISPDLARYTYGDEVTLTAVPGDGLQFGGWGGDLDLFNTENPLTIVIKQDIDASATFADHAPPIFLPIDDQTIAAGERLRLNVGAYDPEGEPVELSARNLPDGATFTDLGSGAGRLIWQTQRWQAGTNQVVLIAGDGELSTTVRVNVEVVGAAGNILLPMIIK